MLGRTPLWAIGGLAGTLYGLGLALFGEWATVELVDSLAVAALVWIAAGLVRSADQAVQLLNDGTDAVVATDAGQRIVTFNKAAETVFGYRSNEVVGRPVSMLLPPRSRDAHHGQIAGFETSERRRRMSPWREVTGIRKNGEEFPCECTIGTLTRGRKTLNVAIVRDITERREAERELHEVQERFRSAFDDAPIGMSVADLDDRILQANRALCEMLGYTEEQLRSMKWTDFSHPDEIQANWDLNAEVLAPSRGNAQSPQRLEKRYIRSDGEIIWVEVSVAALLDKDGDPTATVAHIQDITERRAAQQGLKDEVDSKNELIAAVSHELRTPLTAVLGYAELLRDEARTAPELRAEMVESIVSQATDLSNIVEDLLVAAQAEAGTLQVASLEVDLRDQATRVLEAAYQDSAPPIEVSGSCPPAMGEPSRVRQILRNLISNAINYGGIGIRIEVGESGSRAHVRVLDDGPGIPEEDREQVFEPFHRSNRIRNGIASVGLGLSISRQLARMMGGDLTYRYEDGHSVFELTLRLAPEAG